MDAGAYIQPMVVVGIDFTDSATSNYWCWGLGYWLRLGIVQLVSCQRRYFHHVLLCYLSVPPHAGSSQLSSGPLSLSLRINIEDEEKEGPSR